MTRLIDADAIPWDVEGVGEIPVITKEEIDQLPTVNIPTAVGELVGVIRCKDCKWFGDIGCAISIVDDIDKPSENDYCSFAERKEE